MIGGSAPGISSWDGSRGVLGLQGGSIATEPVSSLFGLAGDSSRSPGILGGMGLFRQSSFNMSRGGLLTWLVVKHILQEALRSRS